MIRIKIAALLFSLIAVSVFATQPAPPVATINDDVISPQVFQVIYQSIKKQNLSATPAIVLNRLTENRLLAIYSKKNNIQESKSKVGFQRSTSVNDQLVGLLRSTFRKPYGQWQMQQAKGLKEFITNRQLPSSEELKALLGNSAFVYELSEKNLNNLKSTTLVHYRFPQEEEQTITLKEIYQRQNVQGRISLHQGDTGFLEKQILQMLDRRSVLYWANHTSGLSNEDLASLKQILADQRQRKVIMKSIGLGDFYHGSNPVFDELVKQVNKKEILEFYTRNKSMFTTIESASVLEMRLSSQKEADQTYETLSKLPSEQLLARFQKIAHTPETVSRSSGHPIWLTGLAFAQDTNKVSKPARLPTEKGAAPSWSIVLVTERVEGILEPNSETVRYEASRSIAQRKANENFQTLLSALRAQYPTTQNLKAITSGLRL